MLNQTPDVVWPEKYETAKKRVERAQASLLKAQRALDVERKKAKIKCCRCSSEHPIETQVYVQTYWYTRPYGCTGGDYWNLGEANWKCPTCGMVNRFEDNENRYSTTRNDFHRPELVALKRFFGKVEDRYDR